MLYIYYTCPYLDRFRDTLTINSTYVYNRYDIQYINMNICIFNKYVLYIYCITVYNILNVLFVFSCTNTIYNLAKYIDSTKPS